MKTMKTNMAALVLPLLIMLLLASCLTLPGTQASSEPWPTGGIQSIAIMPFEVIGNSNRERDAAERIPSLIAAVLNETGGRFIVADSPDQADAVFRGELIDVYQGDGPSTRRPDGSMERIYYMSYIYAYRLVRNDGSIVGERSEEYTSQATDRSFERGRPSENWARFNGEQRMVQRLFDDLGHQQRRRGDYLYF